MRELLSSETNFLASLLGRRRPSALAFGRLSEGLHDSFDRIWDGGAFGVYDEHVLRLRFKGVLQAGHVLHLTSHGFGVHAFDIPLYADF